MRKISFAVALSALTLLPTAPVLAQDLKDILGGVAGAVINQEIDRTSYAQAQQQNTLAAYREYLARFPNGAYRVQAERAIAALGGGAVAPVTPTPQPTPLPTTAASVEANLGLSRSDRITLQRQLSGLGYDTGTADGLWGRNTRAAISRWQTANSFSATGYLNSEQVATIRRQAGPATPVTPPASTADDQVEERLLALTVAERRQMQMALTSLGYSTRGADGVFGANTRRAIQAWQTAQGERVSGYLTADQVREIRRQAGL